MELTHSEKFNNEINKIKKETEEKINKLKSDRVKEILNAMNKRTRENEKIPNEWVNELEYLLLTPVHIQDFFDSFLR